MAETGRTEDNSQASTHRISLHVPGILRLLGEHLYSDPKVALRELIQNAHDSCQRRLSEDLQLADGYQPRIDVLLDPEQRTLIVQDNGSGLTEQEIHTYLATIGRGYTAGLRQRLQFGSRDEAVFLIGQFGLGLLSAFLVADRVEMITRSYQSGHPAWHWSSAGQETYTLAPAELDALGSIFILHLKLAGEFLLNEAIVREAIRTYADFLRIPIYVNRSGAPVNVMDAPWHSGKGDAQSYAQFVAARFDVPDALAIIPLHDHVEAVHHPGGEDDELVTPLGGVLFIPGRSTVSLHEHGDVAVYVRRMLVSSQERELLPRWARFVRGLIDCPVLKPTVSREQVRRDEAFYHVQKAIEAQLTAHLSDLAVTDQARWSRIVAAHNDLIKGWALESPTFFSAICDLVTFETSRGRLRLPEYLSITGGDIYYFVDIRGALQEKMLCEALGLAVIDASRFAEEAFLKVYAGSHPGVSLRQLAPGVSFIFSEVDDVDEPWEMMVRYYAEQGIPARVVRFEPPSIPAILIYPPGSDHIAEARSALESGDVRGPMAELVDAYLQMSDPAQTGSHGTLHLNAANSLLTRLARLPSGHAAVAAALEIIYHNARFFSGRTITPQEARQGFDMIGYSVEQLIQSVEQAAQGSDADHESDVS